MIKTGLGLSVIFVVAFLPGELFRIALQRHVRKAVSVTAYRITDSPDIGVPARFVLGIYSLLVSTALVLLFRFPWPRLVPDPRVVLFGVPRPGDDEKYVLAGLVAVAMAALFAEISGRIQGMTIVRRIKAFQCPAEGSPKAKSLLMLPWSRYSEPWMQALLAFEKPDVVVHLKDDAENPVAGKLLAADVFTAEKDGRGLLIQPFADDGTVDTKKRYFIRAEDVRILISSEGTG